ncbi:MAG: hypothetical protein PHD67_10265 [Oscillospiraceae bacterium]|nr:hypothetical protein [Oscillospiraceae bacterium]
MQRICLAGSAMLPLITVGVSGVMLGMALDALLHEPGGRWCKWLKHVLASAARSAARATLGPWQDKYRIVEAKAGGPGDVYVRAYVRRRRRGGQTMEGQVSL